MTEPLYIGAGNHVAALDRSTGAMLWTTTLRQTFFKAGHDFVTLLVDGAVIYAHSWGRLYALDRATGRLLWENPLQGMGHGLASLAVAGQPPANPGQAHMHLKTDGHAGSDNR
jgi:outer membrane protein assembly factor BamB